MPEAVLVKARGQRALRLQGLAAQTQLPHQYRCSPSPPRHLGRQLEGVVEVGAGLGVDAVEEEVVSSITNSSRRMERSQRQLGR